MTHSRYKKKSDHESPLTTQLGYAVDGITNDKGTFVFCPRCKETVELYTRANKYNPNKIVEICSKCGMIRNSELWRSFKS